MTKNNRLDPGHKIGLVMVLLLLLITATSQRCKAQQQKPAAQIDTMICHNQCIEKFVTTTTSTGKVKYFAVINCNHYDVHDLVPVYANVMDYISTCKQYGIEPTLALRLRNGVITNVIRYKSRYVKNSSKNK